MENSMTDEISRLHHSLDGVLQCDEKEPGNKTEMTVRFVFFSFIHIENCIRCETQYVS